MIISYRWQILQNPISQNQDISDFTIIPQPQSQQLLINNHSQLSMGNQLLTLKCPIFAFIFSFCIEQPKHNPPQLQLVPQVMFYEQSIKIKIMKQIKTKNIIYKEIQIDNCEVFDNMLIFLMKIKYHQTEKYKKIDTIDKLVHLAGEKKINMYNVSTYATIKKDIIIQSPINCQYRFDKEGYLLMKFIRPQDSFGEVIIEKVEIMNWLSNGGDNLKKQIISNVLPSQFILRPKQSYTLLYRIINNIINVEIPYFVIFRLPHLPKKFKVIKHIKIEEI